MYFKNILGNTFVKNFLLKEIRENRVPHAQLFTGGNGVGKLAMAIAFSTYLFCKNRHALDSCGACSSCVKMFKLTHPDLHFVYPTISSRLGSSKKPVSESKQTFPKFQEAVLKNSYLDLKEWESSLSGSNKRAGIRKNDILVMCKLANLKSYEGVCKVFLIWGADKMNAEANSALLKTLEEPRSNTVFILISDEKSSLLKTILSRLQIKNFQNINSQLMVNQIQKNRPELETDFILNCILKSNFNYSSVLSQLRADEDPTDSYGLFVVWIRLCFLSKKKSAQITDSVTGKRLFVIPELINWCNRIGEMDRSFQINFLIICSEIFREGFLLNYQNKLEKSSLMNHENFNMLNFSKHIQYYNISDIFNLLNDCHSCLVRYANSKILFLDLSFSISNLLHKKYHDEVA